MPWLDPASQTIPQIYRCKSCVKVKHDDGRDDCQISLSGGVDIEIDLDRAWGYLDGDPWELKGGIFSCKAEVARDRLYTTKEVLVHFTECQPTRQLLRG